MKRYFLWLVAAGFSGQLCGQSTVQLTTGSKIVSKGNAFIVLNNVNLVNNGNIQQSTGDGTFKFTGSNNSTLGGTGTVFDKLVLSKTNTANLNLSGDFGVITHINFQGGILNLNNNSVSLGSAAQLINESELSRATTTGNGYIEATGNLIAPSSVNPGNLGAIITSSENLGNTIIRRGHKAQTAISGTGNSIERYFDIIPANDVSAASLVLRYFDAELNGINENNLSMWRQLNSSAWLLAGFTNRDISSNLVLNARTSINKNMRWTLAKNTDQLLVKSFPNPFTTNFTLLIASGSAAPVDIRIWDGTGRLIEERRNNSSNSLISIGEKYSQGVYFAEVIQGKEKLVVKLVKQGN